MAYPPNNFNWNWSDLPTNASLASVISTVNWIGQNLDANYTDWIEANNTSLYNNIEDAKDTASDAQDAVDAATGKISRCSYLRGTH